MNEWTAAIEATALATALRQSIWAYPLVNAAHVLGLGLLIGSVAPMDLRLLRVVSRPALPDTLALLRPVAACGLAIAASSGALLFVVQASDYLASPWFRAKLVLIGIALANVALHLRLGRLPAPRQRTAAALSLILWPIVLLCGRMIGYR